jgi:hypothetical protein
MLFDFILKQTKPDVVKDSMVVRGRRIPLRLPPMFNWTQFRADWLQGVPKTHNDVNPHPLLDERSRGVF